RQRLRLSQQPGLLRGAGLRLLTGKRRRRMKAFWVSTFLCLGVAHAEPHQGSRAAMTGLFEAKADAYPLGEAFFREGMPVAASVYHTQLLKAGPGHRRYLDAVLGLLADQELLGDEYLIPSVLAAHENPLWAQLPMESFARMNLLVAMVEMRKGALDE